MNHIHTLYYAAIKADDAWHNELVRLFKKDAGDVRYTKAGKDEPGSVLRKLHDDWEVARDAWALAVQEKQRSESK